MNIFSRFRLSFGETLAKFYTTLGIAFISFIVTSYMIIKDFNYDKHPEWFHLIFALIVGGCVALFFDVSMRRKEHTWARIIPARVLVAFTIGALYYTFPKDDVFFNMAVFGSALTVLLWTMYTVFTDTNRERVVSIVFKVITMAYTMAFMIFGGLSISLSAINFLLFRINDFEKYILIIGAFSLIFLLPLFLLGLAEKERASQKTPQVIRVLAYSIALPLFMLLTTILYIYLAKIVITWSFPSNRINWYASFAALTFIVLAFLIPQFKTRSSNLFARFGGLWMLPIIAVQIIAINIRFQAYGLTAARWVSICCVFVAIVFMIISTVKEMRYIKWLFPITAIVALALTVGPFNAIDFPVKEQVGRLDALLIRNNMLEGEKVVARPDIPLAEKKKIIGSFNMLEDSSYDDKHKLIPVRYARHMDKAKYLGFSEADIPPAYDPVTGDPSPNSDTMYEVSHTWGMIDTAGYSKVMQYDSWQAAQDKNKTENPPYGVIYVGNKTYQIKDQLTLIDDTDKSYDDLIIDLDDSTRLVISNVSVQKFPSKDNGFYLQGLVLIK